MQVPTGEEVAAPDGMVLRDALLGTFRRLIRLYFRDIERLGVVPGPHTHGRVFVANHTNALIDPIVVMTDAECAISPVAKSTLWNVPGLDWLLDRAGAVPIVRRVDNAAKETTANIAVFDRIAAHLSTGGNILIFPEGTSHSEPKLAPLRTGAARMLAAAAARGGTPPTFQAVALEFDQRTDFRSRALVLWGPVRSFADVPGEGEDKIAAVTEVMTADLAELLVEGETVEDRLRIAHVAEMFNTDAGERSLGAWSEAGRRVELAAKVLRSIDPAVVTAVSDQVDAYFREVERLGVCDAQVVGLPQEPDRETTGWKRALLAPLAAAGFALYAAPYFLPRWLARKADADAASTYKLGSALVIYPLWAAGLVAGSLTLLPPPFSFVGAAVAVASPFAALRWLDGIYQRKPELTVEDRSRLLRLRMVARTAIDAAREKLPA